MKMLVEAVFPTKIDQMTAAEPSFFKKNAFLVDFGVPRGSQKWSKVGATPWQTEGESHPGAMWEPFGAPGHFFLDFDVILGPFWAPRGSI